MERAVVWELFDVVLEVSTGRVCFEISFVCFCWKLCGRSCSLGPF